jgi:hypothetical protein
MLKGRLSKFLTAMAIAALAAGPAVPQITPLDPNDALAKPGAPISAPVKAPIDAPQLPTDDAALQSDVIPGPSSPSAPPSSDSMALESATGTTYKRDDVIGAAEGVFGKGAKGLGGIVERILKDQGEPNAYIAGREASGALVVGLRYGSGTLTHTVEGQRPVYWTGPSIGFDVGGDATKTFVLVYNLYDTQDLYRRYPQVEGRAYYVGGFSATYMRRGNVAIIPIRLGVGLRLGVNAGYMKFSEKSRWLPF